MGNPYTSQSISGYNTSPPSDDGATTEANRVNWSKHKTKLGDPIKTLSEAINTEVTTAFGKIALNNTNSQGGSYTVLAADQGKLIRVTGAGTITTPAAATVGVPFMFAVKNEHTAAITLDGSGSENIDGSANYTLPASQAVTLMTDGTDWFTAGNQVDTGSAAGEVPTADQDWTVLASSGTVNIGAAATTRVNITGTTTITAFDTVSAGLTREVRFDGALTLTHNGTSLILPGSANISTASGDIAKFQSEGSGNWRCTKYQPVSGESIVPPYTGLSRIEIVRKASDETVNNSATLQNDDDLVASVAANEEIFFQCFLIIESTTAADFKAAFTVPSGCTLIWNWGTGFHFATGGTGNTMYNNQTVSGTALASDGDASSSGRVLHIAGYVSNGVTSGNLQLQWAQDVATVVDTKVRARSRMILFRE